jgi:NAD(P)-dependent dehydrogenase (short-subunit alcohol dehydrogenase family)
MATTTPPKIWLITGASSGLGLAITLSALHAGHRVIACARNPESAAAAQPEVEKLGGKWLRLDVTSSDTQNIVKAAVEDAGGVDVVVNNAGYMLAGAIEDITYMSLSFLPASGFY